MRKSLVICAGAAALIGSSMVARADTASEVDLRYRQALDDATDRGLIWLAGQQQPDGSFGGDIKATVASLSVMAFMAKGHTPGLGPYGDVINKGIDFVVASQVLSQDNRNGMLASDGRMYGHNMATLMLSQVSGMVDPERQKRVDEALSKALKLTLLAQQISKAAANQGGWRYEPNSTDSDMSHTGWAFMAVRSARDAGCGVPRESIDAGVQFIMHCRSGQGFGYTPGSGPTLPLTGSALLCLELAGKHREEVTLAAGDHILAQGTNLGNTHLYYCLYYLSQGMFQLGGEQWEQFAPRLYDFVLARQNPDGSFQNGEAGGPPYATAMALLALSPSYRQLPIYQR